MGEEYSSENMSKYMSKNPLKKKMVDRLNQRIIESVDKMVNDVKGGDAKVKILDAGCGEGFISKLLYTSFGDVADITGLEYNRNAVHYAKTINPEINFMEGDIYEMPFESAAFDIVLCTEVLEHLEKPQVALAELKRVTRGGILITVPNEPWFCMGNLLALKNIRRFGNPPDHINHWTLGGFKKFVKYNLGEVYVINTSFPWTIVKWKNNE